MGRCRPGDGRRCWRYHRQHRTGSRRRPTSRSWAPRAKAWLATTLESFRLDATEGDRLLAALATLTRIERLETAIGQAVVDAEGAPHPAFPPLAREQRIFLSQWAAVGLPRRG